MSGPHKEAIEASIRAHDPSADKTITEAMTSLHEVQHQQATADSPWVSAT
jgi:hypothetical protein